MRPHQRTNILPTMHSYYFRHCRPHYGYKPPAPVYHHPNSYNHYGAIDDYGNAQHGFAFVSPFAGYGYFGRRRSDFYHHEQPPPPPPPPHYAQSRDDEISVLNRK